MSTYKIILQQAGFEPSVAKIYINLVTNGEQTATDIIKNTGLSRAGVYDAINILLANDYVLYRKQGKNAFYKAEHPNNLHRLIEKKKEESRLLETQMKEAIESLSGSYNLSNNKPGVRLLEGEEGIRESIFDTLLATETIYTYANVEDINKFFAHLNKEYKKEREKKALKKLALIPNTPENIEYMKKFSSKYTVMRVLPKGVKPFTTSLQIYNNKSSYLTLRKDNIIAIIIEDKDLTEMNKHLFEYIWSISLKPEDV